MSTMRDYAIARIKDEVASALHILPESVTVSWDQKHDKPKVGLKVTVELLQHANIQAMQREIHALTVEQLAGRHDDVSGRFERLRSLCARAQ